MLQYLILGGLMGMLGQGARAIVGLKGMSDDAKALNVSPNDLFQTARLVTSFMIGFLVGLAASLAYAISHGSIPDVTQNYEILIGFVAAGYAGTDFLEGFISQYLPHGAAGSTVEKIAASQALTSTTLLTSTTVQKAPTYSYPQAESIVLKAFASRGLTSGVTDSAKLSDLTYKTSTDLLGLLDAVNAEIPDKAHLLPIGAISSWKTVKDVVVSVESA